MKESTKAILIELDSCNWFRAVGQPVAEMSVGTVQTWADAVRLCGAKHWQNVQIATRNVLTETLHQCWHERFQQWNDVAREVRKSVAPLVARKVADVAAVNKLPKAFADSVKWDTVLLLMESEYGDLVPPGFYHGLLGWYLAGHFPCGWQGSWPDGKLVIF